MKKALSLILALIMCLSAAVVIPISASAEEAEISVETAPAKDSSGELIDTGTNVDLAEQGVQYSGWSSWSSNPAYASSTRQVETRRVVVSYDMEGNCCGNSNGQRCYLKYMQSGYTLRLHYDRGTYSKAEVDSWARWPQGSYYTYASNVNGYIIGPGTAYIEPRNSIPLFIVGTNYGTEYRYRDRVYTSIKNCSVGLSLTSYTYDGKAKTPSVTVRYGSTLLYQGWDYTVSYRNNVNVGTASVIINGMDNYNQSITKTFTINPKPADKPKKLSAPKITKITNQSNGVCIKWNKVSGAVKYRVLYKNGSKWCKLGDTTSTSFVHKGVKSGKKYIYTVMCISADGKKQLSAYNTSGVTVKYLAVPKIKSCGNTAKGIKITWSKVNGAAKYCVFIKSGSKWVKIAVTAGTSYLYTKAKSGKACVFTVRCISANGKTFTSAYNTKGWKCTFIAMPKISKLSNTTSGVKITWSKVGGAVKYCIFVKSGKSWKKLGVTKSCSYVHKGVKSGKKYCYTVRCVAANGKTFTSAYNTKGWYITYKKSSNWSALYKSFVLNKKYLTLSVSPTYLSDNEKYPNFRLFDFNKDGVPELLGYTGHNFGNRSYVVHVYTIQNNKVKYISRMITCSSVLGYYPNSKYKGLFSTGGMYDLFEASYCEMKNNKMITTEFATSLCKNSQLTTSVENAALYNAFLACTTGKVKSVCRNLKYKIVGYTYKQISSMGWNAFLKKYGY